MTKRVEVFGEVEMRFGRKGTDNDGFEDRTEDTDVALLWTQAMNGVELDVREFE